MNTCIFLSHYNGCYAAYSGQKMEWDIDARTHAHLRKCVSLFSERSVIALSGSMEL